MTNLVRNCSVCKDVWTISCSELDISSEDRAKYDDLTLICQRMDSFLCSICEQLTCDDCIHVAVGNRIIICKSCFNISQRVFEFECEHCKDPMHFDAMEQGSNMGELLKTDDTDIILKYTDYIVCETCNGFICKPCQNLNNCKNK